MSSSAAQVTVFDPDLDPDGSHARLLTDILSTGLTPLSRDRRRLRKCGARHCYRIDMDVCRRACLGGARRNSGRLSA